MRHPRTRILLWTAAFTALALSGWRVAWVTWWDRNGVDDLQAAVLDGGTGYWGTNEYAPRDSDNSDLNKNAPRVAQVAPPAQTQRVQAATVDIQSWYSEHKAFTVTIPRPATLGLRLLNYPAWRVDINGRTVAARSAPATGQVLIDVPPGISHIRLDFIRTPDRTWGALLSLISLIVWGLLLWRACRPSQTTAEPSHTAKYA